VFVCFVLVCVLLCWLFVVYVLWLSVLSYSEIDLSLCIEMMGVVSSVSVIVV